MTDIPKSVTTGNTVFQTNEAVGPPPDSVIETVSVDKAPTPQSNAGTIPPGFYGYPPCPGPPVSWPPVSGVPVLAYSAPVTGYVPPPVPNCMPSHQCDSIKAIMDEADSTYACFNCYKPGHSTPGGLKKSTRCEIARYCDKVCQSAHWTCHSTMCMNVVGAKSSLSA